MALDETNLLNLPQPPLPYLVIFNSTKFVEKCSKQSKDWMGFKEQIDAIGRNRSAHPVSAQSLSIDFYCLDWTIRSVATSTGHFLQ